MSDKKRRNRFRFALFVVALWVLAGCTAQPGILVGEGPAGAVPSIEQAVLDGLKALNADVDGATVAVEEVLGDFACTTVETPQGGFSAYTHQGDGAWSLLTHGSAVNPAASSSTSVPEARAKHK